MEGSYKFTILGIALRCSPESVTQHLLLEIKSVWRLLWFFALKAESQSKCCKESCDLNSNS